MDSEKVKEYRKFLSDCIKYQEKIAIAQVSFHPKSIAANRAAALVGAMEKFDELFQKVN